MVHGLITLTMDLGNTMPKDGRPLRFTSSLRFLASPLLRFFSIATLSPGYEFAYAASFFERV